MGADLFFNRIEYDVISCFRSIFLEVQKKTAENIASDGFVGIKSNAASKMSSNFSSEDYRRRFRIKRRGVSPSPTLRWARLKMLNFLQTDCQVIKGRNTRLNGSLANTKSPNHAAGCLSVGGLVWFCSSELRSFNGPPRVSNCGMC